MTTLKEIGLPETIKVGSWDISVRALSTHEAASESRVFGRFVRASFRIEIQIDDVPLRFVAGTFFHELAHVAWWHAGVHEKNDDEERIVEGVTTALSMIWRDNPDLFAWLHCVLCYGVVPPTDQTADIKLPSLSCRGTPDRQSADPLHIPPFLKRS